MLGNAKFYSQLICFLGFEIAQMITSLSSATPSWSNVVAYVASCNFVGLPYNWKYG